MRRRTSVEFLEVHAQVLRARNGTELADRNAAFDRLVVLLQDFAVGAAYAYVKDIGLAQDAAQESFVIAWRQLQQLNDPTLFIAWFKRIIASRCHRVMRKKSNRLSDLRDPAPPETEGLEALVGRRERAKLLREAVEQLPAAERVAVALFYFSGRSHAAIAGFLGVPRTAVVKRLFSARQRLKAALSPLRTEIRRARPSRTQEFARMVRAGIYDDYVGLYRFDARPELTVRLERVGNRLVSFSAGQKNRVTLGTRLSELRAQEFDGQAQFVRSKAGRVTHFIYYEFGKRMGVARRVECGKDRSGGTT